MINQTTKTESFRNTYPTERTTSIISKKLGFIEVLNKKIKFPIQRNTLFTSAEKREVVIQCSITTVSFLYQMR